MSENYFIVEASALPEVILRAAEATQLLKTRRASTVGEAARLAGISRSAYYKYRDAVRPFLDTSARSVVTLHLILADKPGILSGILGVFAERRANILTINQSIPVGGVASVSVSADTAGMADSLEALMGAIERLDGVEKIETIAG